MHYITILYLAIFSHQFYQVIFIETWLTTSHPRVSRSLPHILSDLNRATTWIVSNLPLISKYSNLFSRFLWVVPKDPTTIGITITSMFHDFSSLARSRYFIIFSLSFFIQWLPEWQNSQDGKLFFWLISTRSGFQDRIWGVCLFPKATENFRLLIL